MKQSMISAEALQARLNAGERLQLIDVRSPGEYQTVHIPGAMNLPMEQVEARLEDLHRHDPVVLVCQSGRRACLTEETLRHHRDDLLILEGGTQAWKDAGLPVVGGGGAAWSLERQVRLIAGLLVLTGTILSVALAPSWVYLSMFVGAGLTFAGLTNWCGMGLLLAKAPWNQPKAGSASSTKSQAV